MTEGVVVDACIMQEFLHEFLANVMGTARGVVEALGSGIGLAIDSGGKIRHEWFTTCENPYFKEWYAQARYLGKIREVKPEISEQHKKALQRLGLPNNSYDRVYISVANATATRYILSSDIDFFDPCLKHSNEKAKCRARDDRQGKLCRYLHKEMKIRVGTAIHAYAEILN